MTVEELAPYRALAQCAAAALPIAGLRSVYLIGSLARGSFTPGLSDIDLLAFADDAPTETAAVRAFDPDVAISICVRPTSQLYDPLAPLRWSGQPAVRSQKELTAVSDLMFLCDHGQLLFGAELRTMCVLPARAEYRAFLRWEAAVAARGELIPGLADHPRRAAKRIATLLRDLHFLRTGELGAGPDELVASLAPHGDDARAAALAALWLSGLPALRDYDSALANQATACVMDYRERVFALCCEIGELGMSASQCGWPQLADLQSETFQLYGDGEHAFAEARPS